MAEKILLSNGVRLVLEYMPHLRSVAAGVWADTGSAYEETPLWGVSHLLEHMLFKGTPGRNALEISAAMDNVGGILNAFTSKERTCYYTRCLDEHFELALSLLADMYQHSLLAEAELAREKQVVIEEINMYEDTPDELVMDLFAASLWPGQALGRSISGTIESVSALSRTAVADYWQTRYNTADTVLAIAGNVCLAQAAELAEKYFSSLPAGSAHGALPAPVAQADTAYVCKEIEQNHFCLGFPAFGQNDDDYYAAAVANSALGGSASARLFQEIREKRGLAYSAYSYLETYNHSGFLLGYASTQPDKTGELVRVMAGEFARLASQGLSAEEIEKSKQQLKGALLLQMESTSSVMVRLGKTELIRGELYTPEETVAKLMAVSEADVARVIRRLIVPENLVVAQVGPERLNFSVREALSW